jgi:hypothetical protein
MFTRLGLVAVSVVLASSSRLAHGEAISGYGMNFILPSIGHPWTEVPGKDGVVVTDEATPNLTIALLRVKQEGTLDEVMGRAEAELAASSLRIGGKAIQKFKPGRTTDSTVSGASMRTGMAIVDRQSVPFAIAQRKGKTVVLIGFPKNDAAKKQFDAIVKGLRPAIDYKPAPETTPDESEPLPKLGAFAAVKDITASSTFADKSKKDLYGAWRVLEFELTDPMEGYPTTAWCEGKPNEGVGEGITINFVSPTKIDTLDVAAGVWLNEKLFKANNQITSLAISFDGGAAKKVSPPSDREYLEVPVGKAVSSIKITIDAVKKGKMNDSCISAVRLGGEDGPLGIVRGLDAKALAALPAAYEAVGKAIADPTRAGLAKLVQFPFTYESSDWFFEGNQKPVKHANWKSIDTACKKKKAGCPGGPNTGGREDAASVAGSQGSVIVTFPSRREVADQWHFTWTGQEWKLTDMMSGTP